MRYGIDLIATDGQARTGWVDTPRGRYRTPVFMPVGTRGAVRAIGTDDLESLGAEIVLGNTYHLMLRPGADLVAGRGGLGRFMDWHGHTLTDSGGYQVFSLEPKVTDEGARFKSTYDGDIHHLTPESAAEIQARIGADIQMVLDVCPPLPSERSVIESAVERTTRWAERGRAAFVAGRPEWLDRGFDQAQFGIVQGGLDAELRERSARALTSIGFDGYAVGGLSVGESRTEMVDVLGPTLAHLPADQPRYLMGVGDPAGLVEAIGLGIDMFDCVLPTRFARHGMVLTSEGRINLRNARFATDDGPLDPGFAASPANRYSRAYLRHLVNVDEATAARTLTLHNLAFVLDLIGRARSAIEAGTFGALRAEVLEVWG